MVSILMPIYNGVEFIQESIPSILAQTATNWELLIGINGHPPQSTVYQVVTNYIAQFNDSRIRLLDFPDCKGKSTTLNKMVPDCHFNYIALLDVDDIWLPEKLAVQLPYCTQNYDVIGTKCVYFGELNNIVPATPAGDLSSFNFLSVNPVINSSALIKKEFAYWDSHWDGIEDYDLWLRLWKQGRRFYNCEGVFVKHRIHRASAFNAKGNNNDVASLKAKFGGRAPQTPH
jgi:teichuronic acid biosynthesis glycosyltransferase TuaG